MNKYLDVSKQLILLVFITVGTWSCTSSRKVIREPLKEHGAEFLMEKLKEHEVKFSQFSAKFNASYEIAHKKTSVSGNIRIANDSIIWISISPALGIEAVRFMLTPDSIKYLNRMNKTYLLQDFSFINQLLNKTMDYDMAQAFLLGNDFSLYEQNSFKASVDHQLYKLSTTNRQKIRRFVRRSDENISIPIQSIWLDSENFKILKVLLKEAERDSRKFMASYNKFENINGNRIPTHLDFDIETVDKKIRISISYSNIQIEKEQTYPFNVPDNYSQTNDLQPDKK